MRTNLPWVATLFLSLMVSLLVLSPSASAYRGTHKSSELCVVR